jgi:putative endonuclease
MVRYSKPQTTREVGRFGESLAENYLAHKGYEIVARNWTCYAGELDLVTKDLSKKLTFVEVKYIGLSGFCAPEELFTQLKVKHLLRTINNYIYAHACDANDWRLDLVCLSKIPGRVQITHYEDVLHV